MRFEFRSNLTDVTSLTAGAARNGRWEPSAMTTTSVRASTATYTGITTSSWATEENALIREQLRSARPSDAACHFLDRQ